MPIGDSHVYFVVAICCIAIHAHCNVATTICTHGHTIDTHISDTCLHVQLSVILDTVVLSCSCLCVSVCMFMWELSQPHVRVYTCACVYVFYHCLYIHTLFHQWFASIIGGFVRSFYIIICFAQLYTFTYIYITIYICIPTRLYHMHGGMHMIACAYEHVYLCVCMFTLVHHLVAPIAGCFGRSSCNRIGFCTFLYISHAFHTFVPAICIEYC